MVEYKALLISLVEILELVCEAEETACRARTVGVAGKSCFPSDVLALLSVLHNLLTTMV